MHIKYGTVFLLKKKKEKRERPKLTNSMKHHLTLSDDENKNNCFDCLLFVSKNLSRLPTKNKKRLYFHHYNLLVTGILVSQSSHKEEPP